ncbi:MAG: hypothetical protein MJ061_00860, partial [Mailhella sp.]|nr:hypothetical protein [Mailhella sp.]
MKLRSTILACLAALLTSAAPAAAATPSAPAYIDISVQQNIDWRDGLTVRFLPDEKLCRSKYGSKQWQTACGASLGEDGEQVKGISISPQIPGSWRWTGSSEARFIPREPLSPSMTYTVDTSAMRIPSSVRLSRPQAKITTLPAAVSMPQHSVWVDPSARAAHMLSARMTFSYPVRNPSPDLFIVKKTPGSEGLRLGSLKQIWNAEKDSVMLTVPLLSLPHDKGGISFDVTGYPAYSVKDGGIVLSSAKGRNASWMVPVQSSPFVVKRTTLNAVSTETLDKTWELEVSLSMHVRSDELAKSIIVGELPLHNTPGADRPYDWDKAGRIPVALMEQAAPLRLTPMQPGDFASGTLRYRVSPRPGYSIFVKVPESVTSAAGSKLARSWLSIHKAYEFGTELRLLQPGSILPLRGDRKIDIQAMGLDSVR